MKFNRHLPQEVKDYLEREYNDYVKTTPMTKKERRAVREWVKDGNSVYENDAGGWYDGGVPVEYLTVWRDEEYIRMHTKGMSSEETRRFALAYYGWDDDPEETPSAALLASTKSSDEELPF